jgi:hypothetical protein
VAKGEDSRLIPEVATTITGESSVSQGVARIEAGRCQ